MNAFKKTNQKTYVSELRNIKTILYDRKIYNCI